MAEQDPVLTEYEEIINKIVQDKSDEEGANGITVGNDISDLIAVEGKIDLDSIFKLISDSCIEIIEKLNTENLIIFTKGKIETVLNSTNLSDIYLSIASIVSDLYIKEAEGMGTVPKEDITAISNIFLLITKSEKSLNKFLEDINYDDSHNVKTIKENIENLLESNKN